jgi:fibronectin type 3 domain-containing protein
LIFSSQPVGTTSGAQTVTLTNTGGASLSIANFTVTGADASDFAETNLCGSSVVAGAKCTIAVMFTPSATGTRTAALSISDNANGSPKTVSLSGTGSHDVMLSWTASATAGVLGYYVYRGTASGGESSTPLNSTPINGTTYTDANVTAGATYYYVVKTVASDEVTQSTASNQATATVPSP